MQRIYVANAATTPTMKADRLLPEVTERRVRRALGIRLAQVREEHGLTQEDIARALGTVQTLVSRYERGVHAPTLGSLLRLRRLFAVSLDSLVAGAAPGEVADPRVRKLALQMDALPPDYRALVVTALEGLLEATKREVERTRPPGSGE